MAYCCENIEKLVSDVCQLLDYSDELTGVRKFIPGIGNNANEFKRRTRDAQDKLNDIENVGCKCRSEKERLLNQERDLQAELNKLKKNLLEKDEIMAKRDSEMAEKDNEIVKKDEELAGKNKLIQGKEKLIAKLNSDNKKLNKDLLQFQRSIIIIGRTGSGKSTLANVLLNNDNLEIFKEKNEGTSGKKEVQVKAFTAENKVKYRIIDVIGFNDTKLSPEEVINKIKESVCEGDCNLNQVLFVFNGRLERDDIDAFNNSKNILADNIFDENITKYITIVRTGFPGFRNKEKCKKDLEDLIKESKENAEMIKSCNRKLIHVDNPPLNENFSENEIAENKKRREASRKRLLVHLLFNCEENYQDGDSTQE